MTQQPPGDVRPPNPPWKPIELPQEPIGYLSVYYADPMSRLPVRHITRTRDNKSDPNIETATYGLFSTCEEGMRTSIVQQGVQYLFFVSSHGGTRAISGYYRLAWYADSVLHGSKNDYALAADRMHFVDKPMTFTSLPQPLRDEVDTGFRTSKCLTTKQTASLIELLGSLPNVTPAYISEIHRIETWQAFHSNGFKYVGWGRTTGFDWEAAKEFLLLGGPSSAAATGNTSPTDYWQCSKCGKYTSNRSLLKRCPHCQAGGTLEPVDTLPEKEGDGDA